MQANRIDRNQKVQSLRNRLLGVAVYCERLGGAEAQTSAVVGRVEEDLRAEEELVEPEQLQAAWEALFATGKLRWGRDRAHPGPPYFRVVSPADPGG
jgi:hypothetical protein